jgi:hypothetical protein
VRKTPIFCRKLPKIAENGDHNIDPRLGYILGDFFTSASGRPACSRVSESWLDMANEKMTHVSGGFLMPPSGRGRCYDF